MTPRSLALAAACVGLCCGGAGPGSSPDAGAGAPPGPPAVIADIDTSFDDVAALAYLCQEHKLGRIALKAVTVTAAGVAYPGKAIKYARCMLEECGLTIPVADSPATGANTFPATIRDDVEVTLSAVFSTCTQSEQASARSAPDVIVEAASAGPGKAMLLTFGPLTNVALALEQAPGVLGPHLERVSIMGGAVHVPGNLCCGAGQGASNTQELNLWADPAAAATVFEALGPAVRLVSLDATRFAPVTEAYLQTIAGDHHTREADVVAAIAASPSVVAGARGGFLFWWDPLNAAAAVHPGLVEFRTEGVRVVQQGPDLGQTRPASDGAQIQVGQSVDAARFERLFLDALNGRTGG